MELSDLCEVPVRWSLQSPGSFEATGELAWLLFTQHRKDRILKSQRSLTWVSYVSVP
jgi:hypothetical protein